MNCLSQRYVTFVAICEDTHLGSTNYSPVIADDPTRLEPVVDGFEKIVDVRLGAVFKDEQAFDPEITTKGNFRAPLEKPGSQGSLVFKRLVNAQPRKPGPRQWVNAFRKGSAP